MAKQQIRNDIELSNILHNAMYDAIEYTMKKMFEENAELIGRYVYNAYQPELYDRTEEFLDAWNYYVKRTSDHHNVPGMRGRIFGEFFYDPDVMHYNSDLGQHGTPDYLAPYLNKFVGDAREYLADIIYEGRSSTIFGSGPWTEKRNAFNQLVKKMGQGKIFTWFEEGMAKQGLKVYRG